MFIINLHLYISCCPRRVTVCPFPTYDTKIFSQKSPYPSSASTLTMANFGISPCNAPMEYNELIFCNLYLHLPNPRGEDRDKEQRTVIQKDGVSSFGAIAVNNWKIYDGAGPGAKVVAHGRGLHISAGSWHNTFSMVFESERFEGSTLQVMGIAIEDGEWAIVGGTELFAMATGVITKKLHTESEKYNIIELTIRAFCPLLKSSPVREIPKTPLTKIGPWGGTGGKAQNMIKESVRLESITVSSGLVVDSIAFSYIDDAQQTCTTDLLGSPSGTPTKIELDPSEFVTGLSGTLSEHYDGFIGSLKFVTNLQTYGPFGDDQDGTSFFFSVPNNNRVVGFFGRSSGASYLIAIGVYLIQV